MINRFWIYQKERFPILAHGPMVVVFCLAVLMFSSLQRDALPELWSLIGAAISALIFFFQLRVADEYKDNDIDCAYRPHRPVPRGLVQLGELARLAFLGAAIQFFIAVRLDIGLVPILVVVWIYIGLMSREFFVPAWLTRRPVAYLLSHMIVMPLIAFYVSAFDWLPVRQVAPAGIAWLLLMAFACGLILEIGRKIRTPAKEQRGVETYSALWGGRAAVVIWSGAIILSVASFVNAAGVISTDTPIILPAVVAIFLGVGLAGWFAKDIGSERIARLIEPVSGVVAMILYLGVGPIQYIAL